MSLLKNILIVLFLILCIDGCFYRDPGVELAKGYSVGACSGGSPCRLGYTPWRDERTYSDFMALSCTGAETGKTEYVLVSGNGQEYLTFPDEEAWYAAIREHNAPPPMSGCGLENVTSFAADEHHIIGEYDGGYYLVDIGENRLFTYADAASWRAVVEGTTALASARLRDPKSFFLRTRDLPMLIFYALLILVAIWKGIRSRKVGVGDRGRGRSPLSSPA